MAEMCPPQIRGAVVSAKETVIVGGIVVGYAAGNFVSSDPRNWTGECDDSLSLQSFVFTTSLSSSIVSPRVLFILDSCRIIWRLRFRGSSHVAIDI
jgi:hypothetical protein